jgi:hypothetical protein
MLGHGYKNDVIVVRATWIAETQDILEVLSGLSAGRPGLPIIGVERVFTVVVVEIEATRLES